MFESISHTWILCALDEPLLTLSVAAQSGEMYLTMVIPTVNASEPSVGFTPNNLLVEKSHGTSPKRKLKNKWSKELLQTSRDRQAWAENEGEVRPCPNCPPPAPLASQSLGLEASPRSPHSKLLVSDGFGSSGFWCFWDRTLLRRARLAWNSLCSSDRPWNDGYSTT